MTIHNLVSEELEKEKPGPVFTYGMLVNFSTHHPDTRRLVYLLTAAHDPDLIEHVWNKYGAPITCPGCGRWFWPSGREKHCANACRQKAYRKRHPEKQRRQAQRQREMRKEKAERNLQKGAGNLAFW